MLGAEVATEAHMHATRLPNPNASIGIAAYATDCHAVDMVVDNTTSPATAAVEGCLSVTPAVGPWEIPYHAITPRSTEATNLLVPVAVSASHVAFSTIRLELTWMVLGQSAGIAAALAVQQGLAVQDVPLPELHTALLNAGQILHHDEVAPTA